MLGMHHLIEFQWTVHCSLGLEEAFFSAVASQNMAAVPGNQ